MTEFACMPPCIQCRQAERCRGPSLILPHDVGNMAVIDWLPDVKPERKPRDRYPNDTAILPCGCYGMPWPLVHKLGENFDEVFCDAHGWRKVTKATKEKWKKSLVQQFAELHKKKQKVLFDHEEPPY